MQYSSPLGVAGGTCNLKVVLTENKYFRIPSNGNFIRATLGLQKPHTISKQITRRWQKRGPAIILQKQALLILISPGQAQP